MNNNKMHNLVHLKDFRRQLRNNSTPAEATLWSALRNCGLKGRKFRRQHSVGNYIVDFYCPKERLAIELDGEVHNDPMNAECDAERDRYLKAVGIKVVRIENKLVYNDMEGVLNMIAENFADGNLPPLTPP